MLQKKKNFFKGIRPRGHIMFRFLQHSCSYLFWNRKIKEVTKGLFMPYVHYNATRRCFSTQLIRRRMLIVVRFGLC